MKTCTQAVSILVNGKSTKVADASYPEYETISEAVDTLGEDKALELINAQVRTNEMNRTRALYRPGEPSKTLLRSKALGRISGEEFMSCAGDVEKIEALIKDKMAEVELELKTQRASSAGADDAEAEA